MFRNSPDAQGGDEVNTNCWSASPEISAWMAREGYNTTSAYLYYVNRYQQIALSMGREVVGWDEIWQNFGTSLDPSVKLCNHPH